MNSDVVRSVCIFGSVARSKSDSMSDKDVLIVAEDLQERQQLSAEWKARGWSVSAYTPSRFLAMVRSGSLFAQHIKHEGVVVSDEGGWLKQILQKSTPKSSYLADARDSVFLAMPIERFHDDLMISHHPIVADLAFVCVRNFGINYLADKGGLAFDYATIVDRVGRDHALLAHEIELLHSLRAGKTTYRGGLVSEILPGRVADLKVVLRKLFPHRKIGKVDEASPVRNFASGYTSLRDLEASLVAQLGARPNERYLDKLGLKRTWKWIKKPQDYSWQVRRFDPRGLRILVPFGISPLASMPDVSWRGSELERFWSADGVQL